MNSSELNLRLKELRRRRNMSQEEMAQELGISRQAIIAIEQGVSLPSLPVVIAMLRVLDIPFTDLFAAWSPLREPKHHFADDTRLALHNFKPATTIPIILSEDKKGFYLTAELAGIKEEDVIVDMSSQHVLISAVRKPRFEPECETVHANEITYGPLLRIVSLPFPIDTQNAVAEYVRGVLYLTLPKHLPEPKRRITFHEPGLTKGPEPKANKEKHNGSE